MGFTDVLRHEPVQIRRHAAIAAIGLALVEAKRLAVLHAVRSGDGVTHAVLVEHVGLGRSVATLRTGGLEAAGLVAATCWKGWSRSGSGSVSYWMSGGRPMHPSRSLVTCNLAHEP